MTDVYLQRIGTATPDHDIHAAFVQFAFDMLQDRRAKVMFQRLASRSGIEHRFSVLEAQTSANFDRTAFAFYANGTTPSTTQRMRMFELSALDLARRALSMLALTAEERNSIKHLVVTCCTGFYAPGIDLEIVDHLGLSPSTERTLIGFMGCHAGINALRTARHIVRSAPESSVLVINLELCSLHFRETQDLNEAMSFLLFGDGCAASLVSAKPAGFRLDGFDSHQVSSSRELITWRIGDLGFEMFLSGQVPIQITKAMRSLAPAIADSNVELWAVHPGGRAILDAVEEGLSLPANALAASRCVLRQYGNMSSPTVMFVLERLLREARSGQSGRALSFGPGLTAEVARFHAA